MHTNHPVDYRAQSFLSDPGPYHHLFDPLPAEPAALCEILHGCMAIDLWQGIGLLSLPPERQNETQMRSVQEKVARLLELQSGSLFTPRPIENRLLGNCRDLSLVLCAMLRHKGFAARLRSGFATFFDPQRRMDHWICEYWAEENQCWVRIDPWMAQVKYEQELLPPPLQQGLAALAMQPYDVSDEYFLSGGQAWLKIRRENEDAACYGTYEDALCGGWFVRDNLIRDGYCLNGWEVLPWDCWGWMAGREQQPSATDLPLLDQLAQATLQIDSSPEELFTFYRTHPGLKIPPNILPMRNN